MLRQFIKLSLDAVRWELRQWADPTPAGAPTPPVNVTSESSTQRFIDKVKADPRCYRCAREKQAGHVLCAECQEENGRILARVKKEAA